MNYSLTEEEKREKDESDMSGKKTMLQFEELCKAYPKWKFPCPYVLTLGCAKGDHCEYSHEPNFVLSTFHLKSCKNGVAKDSKDLHTLCKWYVHPPKKHFVQCLLDYLMQKLELDTKSVEEARKELHLEDSLLDGKRHHATSTRVVYCYHCIRKHEQTKVQKTADTEGFELPKYQLKKLKQKSTSSVSSLPPPPSSSRVHVCPLFGLAEKSCPFGEKCHFQHNLHLSKKLMHYTRCKTFKCLYLCKKENSYCQTCKHSFEKSYLEEFYKNKKDEKQDQEQKEQNQHGKEVEDASKSSLAQFLFERYNHHNLCHSDFIQSSAISTPNEGSLFSDASMISKKCIFCDITFFGPSLLISKRLFCSTVCHNRFVQTQRQKKEQENERKKDLAKSVFHLLISTASFESQKERN